MSHRISKFSVDKLSRYAEIFPGFAFESERFTDNPSDVALVKGENVQQGFVDWAASKYWPAANADVYINFELRPGDVVLAMDRPWVTAGLKWAYIKKYDPKSLLVQRVSRLRSKTGLDQTYLRCVISSRYFSDYIQPIVTGVNVPHISGRQIGNFKIPLPPPQVQRKIAAILSAYDELIENNKRRIALLEKMAEEIYREWFVRLRFPGHEKVKRRKGVPDGWQVQELKEVAIEDGKSTRPGTHLAERFYLPLDLLTTKEILPAGHADYTEAQSSLVTFEKNDFLFGAMRPYQHKVAIAPFHGITRTTCFVIRPKIEHAWSWLFLTLFQPASVDYASLICNGSDRPYAVWNKGMERMKLLRPDDRLLEKFETIARPILDAIVSMYFVQKKLTACRDMLLPRLISGRLSVEHLDIQFPSGMAEEMKSDETKAAHA